MPLKLYNSLTQTSEDFVPIKGKKVGMYVCGPTVYDKPHLGHLRSAYIFEIIRNYLQKDYEVNFVRNVTDVDDKIIQKASDNKPSDLLAEVKKITKQYYKEYKDDLEKLGIKKPSKEPHATDKN